MRIRPAIVVLAAGSGSRFEGDSHKLEQPFHGSTVLATTVRHAVETQLPVVVVTTALLAPQLARQIATRDLVVLSADEAARGVGNSIAAGVAERSGASGWLVLPADMPLILPGSMLAVATALAEHAVVCPEHQGRRGHPIGFAAELYSELIVLSGDDGVRRLVARYPSFGQSVNDPGVLLGVDTAADLALLRQQAGRSSKVS